MVGEKWMVTEENGSWFLESQFEEQEPTEEEETKPGGTKLLSFYANQWGNSLFESSSFGIVRPRFGHGGDTEREQLAGETVLERAEWNTLGVKLVAGEGAYLHIPHPGFYSLTFAFNFGVTSIDRVATTGLERLEWWPSPLTKVHVEGKEQFDTIGWNFAPEEVLYSSPLPGEERNVWKRFTTNFWFPPKGFKFTTGGEKGESDGEGGYFEMIFGGLFEHEGGIHGEKLLELQPREIFVVQYPGAL